MESRVRSYVHVNHRVHTCACTYRIAVALPEGGLVGTSNIQLLHIESINIHALGLQVFILFYLFIFSGSWNNSGKLTFNINQTFQKTTLDVVVGPDLFRVILVVTASTGAAVLADALLQCPCPCSASSPWGTVPVASGASFLSSPPHTSLVTVSLGIRLYIFRHVCAVVLVLPIHKN